MPELPEVETVCRGLAPVLEGQTIVRVVQRRPDLRFPFPERFKARLEGQRATKVERRAKYILVMLSGGEVLVIHLGMSGRLSIAAKGSQRASATLGEYIYGSGSDTKHDHVVLELASGATITYNDPRRFGFMLMYGAAEVNDQPMFKSLGVEPLGPEFSPAYLAGRASGRKADLKAFLLDQRHIAGLGNIYVSEALHRAGLSPKRRAACLAGAKGKASPRAEALVPAIQLVLEKAIAAGGSTLRDYRQANGAAGAFQEEFVVYDREGSGCVKSGCSGTIHRIVQSGRSTFWCPKCQK
jgi:formamidopyrimidine-DNA glycosylase